MDVLEAIRTRRSHKQLRPDVPPREVIEEILEAATWAPNHHQNEPWRFFVLAGAARARFGQALADDATRALHDPTGELSARIAEAQRQKAVRAPVIVVAAMDPPDGPKIIEVENVCAVACAIQNMLLAAHANGLATKWSTGEPARSEHLKRFFGLTPRHQILGFVYLGYPEGDPPTARRTDHREKSTWLGWPDDAGTCRG